jgi:hypothetical protein
MIDSEFVAKLKELEAKGKDGLVVMREVLKQHGGIARLISLAERGLGAKAINNKGEFVSTRVKTRIPDNFPGENEKLRAIGYWEKHRRPDLVAMVEHEAEMFYNHHYSKGTKSFSWPKTWATWCGNALQFTKPPRGVPELIPGAEVAFEQTNINGWVTRLTMFYDEGGRWTGKWGGKPPTRPQDPMPADCKCPAEAFSIYLRNHGGSTRVG